MKINKREKSLLIILGLIVIGIGYEETIFKIQRQSIATLSSEEQQRKAEYDLINTKINSIKANEMNIKVMNSNIQEKALAIYPSIDQEKIILELDELISKSGIKANISFADKTIGIKAEEDKKNNANNEKSSKALDDVELMKTTLNFKGSYESIMKFLDLVEKNKKLIDVSNLNLNKIGNTEISGSAQLEIYGTKKVDGENEEYSKWKLDNKYGKKNPFDGAAGTFSVEEALEKSKLKEDFVLSTRTINSDLPSLMLGKSNDATKSTYIYSDENKEENVEVYLTNKNDKYYYKYKNSKTSYPLNYNSLGTEFTPSGSGIILKIFSEARGDLNDKSSVNLKIVNDTDKNVQVSISNDDISNPRVKVTSEKGNVQVSKN